MPPPARRQPRRCQPVVDTESTAPVPCPARRPIARHGRHTGGSAKEAARPDRAGCRATDGDRYAWITQGFVRYGVDSAQASSGWKSAFADQPLKGNFMLAALVGDEQFTVADHHAPIQRTWQVASQVFQGLRLHRYHAKVLQVADGIQLFALPNTQIAIGDQADALGASRAP